MGGIKLSNSFPDTYPGNELGQNEMSKERVTKAEILAVETRLLS